MTNAANSARRAPTRAYSLWEWSRAYLVLFFTTLPLFPIMALLNKRRLPGWAWGELLEHHYNYTSSHPMDFRIPPDESVPAYMKRWWWIPRNWAFNIYFHIVCRSDDDRALHDHPWWSFSIVLSGGYYEHEVHAGGVHTRTWYGPGSMRFRWRGGMAHRLEVKEGELPARTIFITGPVLRRWGFHYTTEWVDAYDWDQFCEDHGIDSMKMDGGSDAAISDRNQLYRKD